MAPAASLALPLPLLGLGGIVTEEVGAEGVESTVEAEGEMEKNSGAGARKKMMAMARDWKGESDGGK